jgi:hypothetical protein
MSTSVRTQCPHCQVAITVERPQEPRVGPCPACGGDILIPANWYSPETKPRRSQSRREEAALPTASGTTEGRPQPGLRRLAITLLVAAGVLLLAGGTLVGSLLGALSRPPASNGRQPPVISDVSPRESRKPELESKLKELESRRDALQLEVDRYQREIDAVDQSILQTLNHIPVSVETVVSAMKGVQR